MTQLIDLTTDQLTRKLGRVVTDIELVVAKNLALGVTEAQLCEILGNGITPAQIAELRAQSEFQELYGVIAQHLLELTSDAAIGWDQLEAVSIRNLMREARTNRDPDFQLRLAAVANKAVRRHHRGEQVLDPGGAGTRVQITLNQTFIDKLNGKREITPREPMKHLQNPSLESLQNVLQMAGAPAVIDARPVAPESTPHPERHLTAARPQSPLSSADVQAAVAAVAAAMRNRG